MKLHALSFVPLVTFLVGGLVGCAADGAPEAAGATTSEIRTATKVSLAELTKVMNNEAQGMESGDGCTFSSTSTASGLVLELTDKDGKVALEIKASDLIKHKVKPDGDSSVESYDISGVGSVEMVHADDAFEQVFLTSAKTGKTAMCEVDF